MKNQKGFELIELAMVIVIIGILAIVAIPRFMRMQEKSRADFIEKESERAKTEIRVWVAAINQGSTLDFNGDGTVDEKDARDRPKQISEIPMFWDIVHSPNGPRAISSPYDGGPLFSRSAVSGSGKIRVICPNDECRILGYTNHPEYDAFVDLRVKYK